MTKIIAIGGKKKSGKGLAGTYLSGLILSSREAIKDFKLNPKNNDHCVDLIGGKGDNKNIHINSINPKLVKIYGFADKIKEICSDVFGIDVKLLYGDENSKNSLTHIKWSDMPGVIVDEKFFTKLKNWEKRNHQKNGRLKFGELPSSVVYRPDTFMTVREILQYFGTDVCRRLFNECWVNALYSSIKKESPKFAIITDMRFDNEFNKISSSEYENVCVKLLRDPNNNSDKHASEIGFSEGLKWDIVIDNRVGSAPEMCKNLIQRIAETNILKPDDSNTKT